MSATITIQCPTCRGFRQVRRRDAHRVKQCRQCHLSQIAPKGYAATREKYGENFALRHVRLYRLDHPSCLERRVMDWLDCQGIFYEREFSLFQNERAYLVDFLLASRCIAIEVNGTWAHSHHAERDARKVEALRDSGFDVIELSESDVLTGAFITRLERAL